MSHLFGEHSEQLALWSTNTLRAFLKRSPARSRFASRAEYWIKLSFVFLSAETNSRVASSNSWAKRFPIGHSVLSETSGVVQIQQSLASGGLRAWQSGLVHRTDFDPSGPYGRKILFVSIASPRGDISASSRPFSLLEEDLLSEVAPAWHTARRSARG